MELIPHHCMLCSNNPVDENTGEQQEAIFAPGVDYDWGSSAYICKSCVEIMADLFDRVTVEGFDKLTDKYEALKKAYEKLEAKHEKAKKFIERIQDGGRAAKAVKEGKVKV